VENGLAILLARYLHNPRVTAPSNRNVATANRWRAGFIKQTVRVATQYASTPASWQYLRIYSPGSTSSGML